MRNRTLAVALVATLSACSGSGRVVVRTGALGSSPPVTDPTTASTQVAGTTVTEPPLRSSLSPPSSSPVRRPTVLSSPRGAKTCAIPAAGRPGSGDLIGVVTDDGVHELAPDGSHEWKVAGTDTNSHDPSWTADGQRVALVQTLPDPPTPSGNRAAALVVADVTASCWTVLSDQHADALEQPTWSADGLHLAYIRHAGGTYMVNDTSAIRLELSAADGSRVQSVAPTRSTAAWAPDRSGRLVFSDGNGLELRQGDGHLVTLVAVGDSEFASWSPDATRIAFSISTNSAVWIVHADGTNRHAITPRYADEPHAFVFLASWSPDGRRIAYVRECCSSTAGPQSGNDVWIVNSDGSDAHQVSASHSAFGYPRWSPGGDKIAFEDSVTPGALAGASTSSVPTASTSSSSLTAPSWSPTSTARPAEPTAHPGK